jgi:hypothetical protein
MDGHLFASRKNPRTSRGSDLGTCLAVRGGPSYWCGLAASSGVEGRAGLVTPAMKWRARLVASPATSRCRAMKPLSKSGAKR